ncbi:acyl carrier protein [Ligilactobacillus sp. WILCCON 0076]|uniref:Acyl carrier protein n=1 Tax=Ligilactobacillus ubinensis TaxID=2876789 RepID=A0A9X2FJQ9_9LACO|nr:acyl carrier protein [Ligilactobacillus ubinensis]MCP0886987.1 acyl carrier protein [Ligilactobacillus ubinensis]
MTEEEIFAKIAQIIEEHFEISADKVTKELSFQDDLNADSIDAVEFVLELEDTFGSEISDEDAEKIATVGDAVKFIKVHQK